MMKRLLVFGLIGILTLSGCGITDSFKSGTEISADGSS